MKKIQVNNRFVNTVNVRNFEVMMDGLALSAGEGRLACVFGWAGLGKTRTAQVYGAAHNGVYLRTTEIWRHSELYFLQGLLAAMGIKKPPHRKGPCFQLIIDMLTGSGRAIFVDELERLPAYFLDLVRDIADIAMVPAVLIGEEELVDYMRRNKRVWSRTFRQLEFKPIDEGDIILYVREISGLAVSARIAAILHRSSGGDFRIVRRDLLNLVQIANAKQTTEVTEEMAKIAIKQALSEGGAGR